MHRHLAAFAFFLFASAPVAWAAEPPRIVASIPPVHSLVAAVAEGVSEPALLLRGGASPHAYSMAPSDARALQDADLVVWVGPSLETFLLRALRGNRAGREILTLVDLPTIKLLPARSGEAFETDPHDHSHDHDHGDARKGHDHADDESDDHDDHARSDGAQDHIDAHLWLDPANARAIVAAVADTLVRLDPERATAYRSNAARALAGLDELDGALGQILAPVRDRPFVVFHDAYQYLEDRYGLAVVGAITVAPDRKPGARRLRAIHDRIATTGAACVFAEPQFRPDVIATVIEGTTARAGVADPLGAELSPGPDLYGRLMTALASSLAACLTPTL